MCYDFLPPSLITDGIFWSAFLLFETNTVVLDTV